MSLRVYVCLMLISAGNLIAEENPFGLPEPESPDRPGKIMLHGGGKISMDVFERFIELAGGTSAKIVIVPSAGFDSRNFSSTSEFEAALRYRYAGWCELETEQKIEKLTFLHTEDPDDANDNDFVAPLIDATGV